MNITLLVNRDVASCLAVNYLLPTLQDHHISLFLSSRVGSKTAGSKTAGSKTAGSKTAGSKTAGSKTLAQPLQQLKLVEQDIYNEFIFPLLQQLNDSSAELLGFNQLGRVLGGRLSELNTINAASGLQLFAATEPDLVLSIRYGSILKDEAIAIPRHGVLNLHSGRLPDYQGVMATFWALLNGETEIGTTLHYIDDSSIDTGPVVATTSLAVQADHSYLWHVLELYQEGCRTMSEAVQAIADGDGISTQPQPDAGNYYSFPSAADLENFTDKGWQLFHNSDVMDVLKRFVAR